MSLPSAWVDRLFARISIRYGRQWVSQWEGVDANLVKADWGDVLDGFEAGDIAYALEHMPAERPPTVMQFRDLCRKAPRESPLALPPPDVNTEVARTAVAALQMPATRDGKTWARELRERELAGLGLTKFQREAWRQVLEVEV